MPRKRKRPSQQVKKKTISKRQQTSLNKHSKHHSAKHMAFMKRRMLMGDTMRQAHKKAQAKTGK
tara:strand:+ start:3761 stop:3952 length:192 start_codon:yes stop_codon:yes gene_type:complete